MSAAHGTYYFSKSIYLLLRNEKKVLLEEKTTKIIYKSREMSRGSTRSVGGGARCAPALLPPAAYFLAGAKLLWPGNARVLRAAAMLEAPTAGAALPQLLRA